MSIHRQIPIGLKKHIGKKTFLYLRFKYICKINDFQHWCIGVYQRQVCGSDIVHFMHWKSTRRFGETLCVFLYFWRISTMAKGFATI